MHLRLSGKQIYLASEAVDFRKAINGLCSLISGEIQEEEIYIFYNKGRDKLKILGWHRNGFILLYKRLEKGRFSIFKEMNKKEIQMSMSELQLFFEGAKIEKKLPLSPEPMDTSRYA